MKASTAADDVEQLYLGASHGDGQQRSRWLFRFDKWTFDEVVQHRNSDRFGVAECVSWYALQQDTYDGINNYAPILAGIKTVLHHQGL